ncbi:MAG TPA: HAMP domain-containing protein, partial [Vicinamibacterales bacterium]
MRNSLWTRLYLTIALLLAVSIAASALLSRRATLVEVRELTRQSSADVPPLAEIGRRVAEEIARGVPLDAAVRDVAADRQVSLVVVDAQQRIAAASRPEVATARVRRATPEGELILDITEAGSTTALAVRGAPPLALRTHDGQPIGMLYALPSADGHGRVAAPLLTPLLTPLVMTNVVVIAVALLLTYALSRRILHPVGELRTAAERMQRGELGVQVEVRGRDEIAELGQAFNSMASRLAETERLRRQMVSDVAHELRSPVTNLRCTLEAIQDGLA